MKACIYNPYLDTLGGGERYTMAVATTLVKAGYKVNIEWKEAGIKNKLENRFGINLGGVEIVPDVKRGDGYDVCFWVSDGSVPLLRARSNFLHFQIPFKGVKGKGVINKMKFYRIKKVICNSFFTKGFIDQEYGVVSLVLHPPVDTNSFKPKRTKENIILYVGRFSKLAQNKRQDVLIECFKRLYDKGFKNWRLILAGGAEVGVGDFIDELNALGKGYPIKIIESPSFGVLKDFYASSKIFWSASGFGVSEEKEPLKVEHFGISVLEAMSSSSVPLAFKAGGHKEIIEEGRNGYLWEKKEGLIKKTEELITNLKLFRNISSNAREDSKKYSYERFEKEFTSLL